MFKMKSAVTLVFATLLLLAANGARAQTTTEPQTDEENQESVDPSKYFTVDTAHFHIHYPEDLATFTKEVTTVAEDALQSVVSHLKWTPKGKIHLVLSNKNDQSNGFATVVPYNYVFLFVAPPQAGTSLDNYKDYLRLLLQHELTHIVHIDQHHGIVTPLRFVFGKVINPNVATPTWMREGMAVFEESQLDDDYGRNNSDYTNMVLRSAVYDKSFPRIDQIIGATPHFPGGNGPYAFGGEFFDWLGKTYGEDKMYAYQKKYSATLWFYALNGKAKKIYGKSFPKLWDDFTAVHTQTANELKTSLEGQGLSALTPVLDNQKEHTSLAFYTPRPNSTGYAYFEKSFDEGPRLFIYPEAGVEPIILKKPVTGQMSFSKDGRYLAFSTYAGIEAKANQLEVYLYDLQKKKIGRMYDTEHKAKSMHASDPDWSSADDGARWLVMVRQFVDTDQLTIFDAVEKKNYIITEAPLKTQFSNPRFSPDGELIAVSRKDPDGQRDIVVYSKTGQELFKITNDSKIDDAPFFSPDGKTIYFTSYYTGIANIFAYDVTTDQVRQISNVLTGAFQPIAVADGSGLTFELYSSLGNSIQKLSLTDAFNPQGASYPVHPVTDDKKTKPAKKGKNTDVPLTPTQQFYERAGLTGASLPVAILMPPVLAVPLDPVPAPLMIEAPVVAPTPETPPADAAPTPPVAEPVAEPVVEPVASPEPVVAPPVETPPATPPVEDIYTKNRRNGRDLNLDGDVTTITEPADGKKGKKRKNKFDGSEETEAPAATTTETAATPQPDAEKNEPSAFKDALAGKPADIVFSVEHPEGKKVYNAFPMILVPRYLMPNIISSENATLFELSTGNFDPLNRHTWNLTANYRTDADFFGGSALYVYKRYNPLFFVGAVRYAVDWGDLDDTRFFEQRWQAYGGLSYAMKANRFSLSYFYEDRDNLTQDVDSILLLNMEPYAGVRFRYTYGKWKDFANSISQENGLLVKMGVDYVDTVFGAADVNEEIVTTGDVRFYLEMPWSQHHVLALRVASGWKFGDEPQVNGVFRLGGPFGEGVGAQQLSNRVFPLRGLPSITLAGDRVFIANAEYRIPLATNVNRGISTWPIFMDKLYLALFVDSGDITYAEYDSIIRSGDATDDLFSRYLVAPGIELKGDFVIGYGVPLTLRLGYAVIVTNVERVESVNDAITGASVKNGSVYLQVGTSF